MKAKNIFFASRLASLAIFVCATVGLPSCGNEEPSIDELLSQETTPITFESQEAGKYSPVILFDYAGNNYVGSDTMYYSQKTIDLRQGKHHLVWFYGLYDELWDTRPSGFSVPFEDLGPHYNPVAQTVTVLYQPGGSLVYGEKDLQVYPYLMPVQKVELDQYLTAAVVITITDKYPSDFVATGERSYRSIGEISGYPRIKTIGLFDNRYTMAEYTDRFSIYPSTSTADPLRIYLDIGRCRILCPKNGLTIQLKATANDKDGKAIRTTPLPKFSIRRGYTTVLRGPLFSGSTSDWTVEMQPYE